jgi:hypothetical protein
MWNRALGDFPMCSLGVSNRGKEWVPLEVKYKGCRTRAKQMMQEQQGEVECYV